MIFRLAFVLGLGAIPMAGCYQAGGYGQADVHPSNIYTPGCHGDYANCAYDSAKHHTDGNPN